MFTMFFYLQTESVQLNILVTLPSPILSAFICAIFRHKVIIVMRFRKNIKTEKLRPVMHFVDESVSSGENCCIKYENNKRRPVLAGTESKFFCPLSPVKQVSVGYRDINMGK